MKEDISHLLEKSLITGASTSIISAGLLGFGAQYQIPGTGITMPFLPVAFTIGAINSAVVDALHLGVNGVIPISQKAKDISSYLAGVGISGATFYLLLHLGGLNLPSQFTLVRALAAGAIGELAGAGIYTQLKENLYL